MPVPRWTVAALVGLGPAAVVAQLPGTWPALALASGALPVAATVFVLGGERRYYSAAGSAYCVALGAVALAGVLPAGYAGSPALALLSLGSPSAAVVAAIYGGERLLERGTAGKSGGWRTVLSRTLTAVALLRLARTGFAVGRLALFAGALVVVGTATFALDGLGVAVPIPWVGGRVDAVLLGFVGAVLVGFHGLAAAHTTLLSVRDVAGAARDVRRRVASRDVGEPAREGRSDGDDE